MSAAREAADARDARRRQAHAAADREARALARDLDATRMELEDRAAALALGTGDEAAVEEVEAELDRLDRALRRARATVAGLAA
jgi:hypothetical protein